MIYASLTDNELRRAIDNAPQDIAIRDEVVRRFLHADTPDEIRAEGYEDGRKAGFDEGYEQGREDAEDVD